MATFLVRAAGVAGVQLRGDRDVFPDDDGSVHEPNIDAAAVAGLTGGRSDGTYGPTSSVLRSQMASFLARMLDLLVEERITPAR